MSRSGPDLMLSVPPAQAWAAVAPELIDIDHGRER